MSATLISIIGPIGVGKTTLAEKLAELLSGQVLYEDYEGNPFLAGSYAGLEELILPSQLYFMMSRVKQLSDLTFPAEGIVVADFAFCQDRMYAKHNLADDDRLFYEHITRQVEFMVHSPAIIVNLDASVATLKSRIASRGRPFEQAIAPNFLEYLRQQHLEFTPPKGCFEIRIDCDKTDITDQANLKNLADKISQNIQNWKIS